MLLPILLIASVATAADLPTAESLMDKFVEATGGKAAYSQLKSQTVRSEIEFVGQGIKGSSTTLSVYPNRVHTTLELGGIGKMYSGNWDGNVWESSAMQGHRLLTGVERSIMLRLNDIRAAADWRKYYASVTTEAEETVDGKSCFRVVSIPKDGGKPETSWLLKDSGLVYRTRMTLITQMGEIPLEITVGDYQKVGPFLLPHTTTQQIGPQKMSNKILEVRFDSTIEDQQLEPPAEIKALIAKGTK